MIASTIPANCKFHIADTHSVEEVAKLLQGLGYEPGWKDWEAAPAN